jgi:hypothetical protein
LVPNFTRERQKIPPLTDIVELALFRCKAVGDERPSKGRFAAQVFYVRARASSIFAPEFA